MTIVKRVGRKTKPEAEKETFLVPLRFTQLEGEKLKEMAGRQPLATFLKQFIRENTDI